MSLLRVRAIPSMFKTRKKAATAIFPIFLNDFEGEYL